MKTRPTVLLLVFIFVICTINCISAENKSVSKTDQALKTQAKKGPPVAFVPEATFKAQPVIEGSDIIHEFVIKNTGGDTLNISRVKTG